MYTQISSNQVSWVQVNVIPDYLTNWVSWVHVNTVIVCEQLCNHLGRDGVTVVKVGDNIYNQSTEPKF